ncbi:MAG TPA: 50S ribosomal protein L28 [Candidatus Megaira endosymbiont of Nemacystus decipiens]|nr:50S ribosomal protein L28 [Candidatus Megaera endosymbiont of Nemacystus decipiens]
MSRKCELTGVAVQFGNNVSHSQRKTRRRFEPNVKNVTYNSDITGKKYKLKVVTKAIRTIEKLGGFDSYMLKVKNSVISHKAERIKNEIVKKQKGTVA